MDIISKKLNEIVSYYVFCAGCNSSRTQTIFLPSEIVYHKLPVVMLEDGDLLLIKYGKIRIL